MDRIWVSAFLIHFNWGQEGHYMEVMGGALAGGVAANGAHTVG